MGWHRGLGAGAFEPTVRHIGTASYVATAAPADLDGDLDLDVGFSEPNNDNVYWSENVGGSNFPNQTTLDTASYNPYTMAAADIDGDGNVDLVVSGGYSVISEYGIYWFHNLGGGSFAARQVLCAASATTTRVLAPDFDGDGFGDLEEVQAGSDPLDSLSVPAPFAVPGLGGLGLAGLAFALASAAFSMPMICPSKKRIRFISAAVDSEL